MTLSTAEILSPDAAIAGLPEVVARLRAVATASLADACDALVGRRCYLDDAIKPRINEKKIVGPAATVLEGPIMEHAPPHHALDLIDEAAAGSVICISAQGETDFAVWGGLMTAGAVANRHEGAVLDAGVRDVHEIRRDYDFPVFARSVSPGTTLGRYGTLAANVPIRIGGVWIRPGDMVVGDVDGVVVIPRERLDDVLALAEEIDARELEQARLIVAERSLRKGLAKYGRI